MSAWRLVDMVTYGVIMTNPHPGSTYSMKWKA